MQLATSKERREKRRALLRAYYYRDQGLIEEYTHELEGLQILCSKFIFTQELKPPSLPVGKWANTEVKYLRKKAKVRLAEYKKNLQDPTLEAWRKTLVHNKIAYTLDYIDTLERSYLWHKIRKMGSPKPPPPKNIGRKGYTFEEVRTKYLNLIRYAAGVTSKNCSRLETEDLIQEGELKLLSCFQRKGEELGWDSFSTYFKCSLWRLMSDSKKKVESHDSKRWSTRLS